MAYVIVKVIDVRAVKEIKFAGDDEKAINEAERVEVRVTPVSENSAVVVVTCDHISFSNRAKEAS